MIKKNLSLILFLHLFFLTEAQQDSLTGKSDSLHNTQSGRLQIFKVVGKAGKGKTVMGIASFYSANLDGSLTATGERYRNNLLTAASNNFKFNTWVLVTNLRNKQTVIVRINDRMHPRMKKKGRVVDLSRRAARQLNFMDDGLTRVKVEIIELITPVDTVKLSPESKAIDTLTGIRDSIILADSVLADPVKTNSHIVFGIASFYSSNLDGSKTATGEIYRNSKMSAASNNFKLNTWVRVTNLKNNKSIILRINDRMHKRMQLRGRVIDLSRIAANRLDFIKKGLTNVKVEVVAKGTLE
ncbi:MAG: septal ring lytic transglycosylase RlpA family protein [Sediminibacterium sp.]|nr:septal ring lytic transglycosylase RlpA family protein [Sediminibacterium sp.]